VQIAGIQRGGFNPLRGTAILAGTEKDFGRSPERERPMLVEAGADA
jgi:hypothetical protein